MKSRISKKLEEIEKHGELPRKPVPKGMEGNSAFMEYMNMSREEREALKTSGYEVQDVESLANARSKIDALQAVVESDAELIRDQKRVLNNYRAAFKRITQALLEVAEEDKPAAIAVREITKVILDVSGVDVEE